MNAILRLPMRIVADTLTVPIRDCVHYCGFRYGRGEFNPYENFVVGLAAGRDAGRLAAELTDFLRHYRPRTLADVLGVPLAAEVPPWEFPWRRRHRARAWVAPGAPMPDILTHFTEAGIPRGRIDEECRWLERALAAMRDEGYHPERHTFARVIELVGAKKTAYLVRDGNHRIAALHALSERSLRVRRMRWDRIVRSQARQWPGVRAGRMSLDDALRVFDAYFHGNQAPFRAADPAPILG